ncbi:eukaryotic membrane protein family-domain-containing protein [Naematelia encephala]|uniref:Eukaryotic membrane protein family-domain-containing protein n=1 Tax=Naematelia encephala TaxID=71784 RepID=A0A1Y2ATI3_9TREE|nr:eukaryotic membrane protein family-domain-containing protein [Naematelia encephala]
MSRSQGEQSKLNRAGPSTPPSEPNGLGTKSKDQTPIVKDQTPISNGIARMEDLEEVLREQEAEELEANLLLDETSSPKVNTSRWSISSSTTLAPSTHHTNDLVPLDLQSLFHSQPTSHSQTLSDFQHPRQPYPPSHFQPPHSQPHLDSQPPQSQPLSHSLSNDSRPPPRLRHKTSTTSLAQLSHPSLPHLDLPLHTSSSAIFSQIQHQASVAQIAPPMSRQTTYSSLPPSPRFESLATFSRTDKDEVEGALARLGLLTSRTATGGVGTETERERDEVFWPARSRRPTLDLPRRPTLESAGDRGDDREHVQIQLPRREDARSTSPEGGDDEVAEENGRRGSVGLSLWDLLTDEAGAEDWEGWIVDGKWERISNFLAVPLAVERLTLFGALLCLDTFLYNFTILPLRAILAITNVTKSGHIRKPTRSQIHALIRLALLVIPTGILLAVTDASKMYHSVRGQDTIKLYVIFNALEIADRLCCAFGQDVLDTLFARNTLAPRGKGRKRHQARPVFFFMLALCYVLTHTVIFFYMLVSLNVAINSYDYTLLSLLISNQFVEIKGSVFKKFEKENLFQIMCADIVERFQLGLMLTVIALRNMIEMSGSEIAILPKSFMRGKSLVDSILSPVLFVIVSEMVVDWLKHAFITKFNHVRASVYGRFTDVLAKDVLLAGQARPKGRKHPILLDQSPLVARRLGFASIPLACLVIRVGAQAVGMLTTASHSTDEIPGVSKAAWAWWAVKWTAGIGVGLSAWGCLVALKVLLGLSLLSYSALRQEGMEAREAEDAVNDFGRPAVGETKEETAYNKQTTEYLSHQDDDLPEYTSPTSPASRQEEKKDNVQVPGQGQNQNQHSILDQKEKEKSSKSKSSKKSWKLEEVERWTMVKRIW